MATLPLHQKMTEGYTAAAPLGKKFSSGV